MVDVVVGSVGVGLLLIAFAFNLLRIVKEDSYSYLIMNIVGSLMAAYYAYAGLNIPFIILELVWGLAALVRLIIRIKKDSLTV